MYNCQTNNFNLLKKNRRQLVTVNLAENIKFYRKSMNLTQEQLANKLNGKKSLVSNYENGHSTPDIFILIRIADIFQVSLDELVGRRF